MYNSVSKISAKFRYRDRKTLSHPLQRLISTEGLIFLMVKHIHPCCVLTLTCWHFFSTTALKTAWGCTKMCVDALKLNHNLFYS